MSDTEPDPVADETFDEVRHAAGAVIASLKRLIDAAERVVEDPDAFAQVINNGRSVFGAVIGGFAGGFGDPAGPSDRDSAVADETTDDPPAPDPG